MIKLIRAAKDANEARDELMKRDWPARDVAAMVTLIDDPRHSVSPEGTTKLSAEQAKAILDLRLQRLTALGRDEIKAELDKLADEIADYLDILRSRARIQTIVKDELAAIKSEFAAPRRTVIIDQEGEMEDEDLIQREDGRHGFARRLRQACAALHLPRAKARRQRPRRHADSRGGFRHAAVRRLHAHAGAVLFLARPGLQGKGLAAAAGSTAGARQGGALINILPLDQGESITTIMPLPEDEASWDKLDVMFATTAARCGATSCRTSPTFAAPASSR